MKNLFTIISNVPWFRETLACKDSSERPQAPSPSEPVDVLKDPYVLEFLDLPEGHELVENQNCDWEIVVREQQPIYGVSNSL